MGIPRRPIHITEILNRFRREEREDYSRLLGYILNLEHDIQELMDLDYEQRRLDSIAINDTIKDKNILIEELTNLLEPKED